MNDITALAQRNQQLKAFITGFLSDPEHDSLSANSMTAEVFRIALASLESRTVTVKLAEDRVAESEISGYDGTEFYRSGWNARGKADRDALAAAGIQVIEGEGQ